MRDKWNFRAGCIEQIHCGYMYIRVRVPSKKKRWGMPGTDKHFILSIKQVLDRIKWGAPFIIIKHSVFVTGRVDSQVLPVFCLLLINIMIIICVNWFELFSQVNDVAHGPAVLFINKVGKLTDFLNFKA